MRGHYPKLNEAGGVCTGRQAAFVDAGAYGEGPRRAHLSVCSLPDDSNLIKELNAPSARAIDSVRDERSLGRPRRRHVRAGQGIMSPGGLVLHLPAPTSARPSDRPARTIRLLRFSL